MQILHLLAQLPDKTGSGIYFKNLFDACERAGDRNAGLFAIQPPFPPPTSPFAYPISFRSEELPFPIVGMSDQMPYPSRTYASLTEDELRAWIRAFRARMQKAKEEFQPDLVLCHHLWMLASLARETFPTCPVIGISHGTDLRQCKKNPRLKETYVQGLNRLDLVFALSQDNKEEIQREFAIPAHKIKVTGGGYESASFYPPEETLPLSRRKIRLLYAGRLAEPKGIYDLARAYSLLCKDRRDMCLTIVCDGNKPARKKLQACLQGAEDVEIRDFMPPKELGETMRNHDLYLLPSLYEALGLTAIEALASGLFVLAGDHPGLHELVRGPIENSGVIRFVPLPHRIHVDQLSPSGHADYVRRLRQELNAMLDAFRGGLSFPPSLFPRIEKYSWTEIFKRQRETMRKLLPDK